MKQGRSASPTPLLGTLALVFVGIVVLFFVDTFLARMERSESRIEAQRFYQSGQQLMKEGRNDQAADQFRAALAVDRSNQEYQLALAQALTNAGQLAKAEASLADLLGRDGTAGAPNLAMARVLVKEGRVEEALSYYHRAIYGQWKQNALAHRVQIRFELIDLLVSRKETEGLLAELLPLQEEAPADIATKEKLGNLFTSAGSPVRAAELFREVLRRNPQDEGAYAGLGDAEFARGNYRTALAYFQAALRLRPADDRARQRSEICTQVLALDPTQRGLSTEEQFKRSVKVLDLVLSDVRQCLGASTPTSTPPSPGPQDLIDAAAKALKQRVTSSRQGAAVEVNLDLADKLWQLRKTECKAAAPPAATPMDEPLSLVLNRIAQ